MFVAGFGLCLFVRVTVLREEWRWGVREFHDLVFGDNFVPTGSLLDSERTSLMPNSLLHISPDVKSKLHLDFTNVPHAVH